MPPRRKKSKKRRRPNPNQTKHADKYSKSFCKKYREPHLQKSDILALIGSGKKSGANRFIIQVGYYNLINMFRLEHARLYGLAHPEAKQSEIAEAAGFASGSSFSKAKRSVPQVDPEIVSGVKL